MTISYFKKMILNAIAAIDNPENYIFELVCKNKNGGYDINTGFRTRGNVHTMIFGNDRPADFEYDKDSIVEGEVFLKWLNSSPGYDTSFQMNMENEFLTGPVGKVFAIIKDNTIRLIFSFGPGAASVDRLDKNGYL